MLKQLLLLSVLAISQPVLTQNWTNTKNILQKEKNDSVFKKEQYLNAPTENHTLVHLNISMLKTILKTAPERQFNTAYSEKNNQVFTILKVPLPDGNWQTFHIVESPGMHPALAKKYPNIKSYRGQGSTDPTAVLYFDISRNGFHGMIISGNNEPILIDPVLSNKDNLYKIYYKYDFNNDNNWNCHVPNEELSRDKTNNDTFNKSDFCGLKTFRIAISCTGEYAQYHGGTRELALAAMNTTLTRLNGIYERDLSVFLQMVADNDLLVFLNPYSDPFSNNNGWEMLEENQKTCDGLIGENNYDIGHVLSTQGGGLAQIRSVCKPGLKAMGVTGITLPEGDPYDIDYVAHEIGHQFGANHTQNNNCNRHSPTAVEPGSGSSIMGYAGICFPNVQSNSDAYFHAISIKEINNYIGNNGDICANIFSTNNSVTADAGQDFTIPKSTPFKLTGTAYTDLNNESILFNWEQLDNQVTIMPPSGQNNFGPLFRTYHPTTSSSRYFPKISTLVRNENSVWEALPDSEREMNFMFSVRGNQLGGSCNDMDDMVVRVTTNAGPFKITVPSTGHWVGGNDQEIIWDVAGTANEPINCSHVDILLSKDGGYTYPYELAANVPNIGFHKIIVPNIESENARVMVKGVGNIFFDISDHDLIISPSAEFWVSLDAYNLRCKGDQTGYINANPIGGNGGYKYLWSNGETTNTIYSLAAGNYTVTVVSDNRSAVASAVVHDPAPFQIDFVLKIDDSNPSKNILTALASGGTGDLTYHWENGNTGVSTEILSVGYYTVTVTDANGCFFSDSYYADEAALENQSEKEDTFLANRPDAKKYVHVSPNPSTGFLQIEFYQITQGGPELFLFDVVGREVLHYVLLQHQEGLRHSNLDLSGLKNGCYILQIVEGGIRRTVKVVKL